MAVHPSHSREPGSTLISNIISSISRFLVLSLSSIPILYGLDNEVYQ